MGEDERQETDGEGEKAKTYKVAIDNKVKTMTINRKSEQHITAKKCCIKW